MVQSFICPSCRAYLNQQETTVEDDWSAKSIVEFSIGEEGQQAQVRHLSFRCHEPYSRLPADRRRCASTTNIWAKRYPTTALFSSCVRREVPRSRPATIPNIREPTFTLKSFHL